MDTKRTEVIFPEIFDRIYVINLASRPDRLKEIEAQLNLVGLSLGKNNVRRFDAVRPDSIGQWPSIGARGCFMSHLRILQEAANDGLESIAILEDDLDWSDTFLASGPDEIAAISDSVWGFLHGGLKPAPGRLSVQPLAPEQRVLLAHFIALRGDAIGRAADYLERMAARPPGSPEGGPMHVDGAYSWFRKDNPDIPAAICVPALGYQRSSATDIAEQPWYDRVPALQWVVRHARKLRARFR